jgi:hypothetical protein
MDEIAFRRAIQVVGCARLRAADNQDAEDT